MFDRFCVTRSIFRLFWDLGDSAVEYQLHIAFYLVVLLFLSRAVFDFIFPIVSFRTIFYYSVVY